MVPAIIVKPAACIARLEFRYPIMKKTRNLSRIYHPSKYLLSGLPK